MMGAKKPKSVAALLDNLKAEYAVVERGWKTRVALVTVENQWRQLEMECFEARIRCETAEREYEKAKVAVVGARGRLRKQTARVAKAGRAVTDLPAPETEAIATQIAEWERLMNTVENGTG